jgi:hypothetical protein
VDYPVVEVVIDEVPPTLPSEKRPTRSCERNGVAKHTTLYPRPNLFVAARGRSSLLDT